jgi:8-oxo-dGTP diphosphatase
MSNADSAAPGQQDAAGQRAIEVAAGLVFREGKLLITRRHPDSHLGGLWEFPGGKREWPETFEQCLIRELREELGIEVEVGEAVESLTHIYPEKTVHLRFFRCLWRRHEPRALDCLAFRWIGPEELRDHEFPAADARLLQRLLSARDWWR